jgi:hypothetical protein
MPPKRQLLHIVFNEYREDLEAGNEWTATTPLAFLSASSAFSAFRVIFGFSSVRARNFVAVTPSDASYCLLPE